MGEILIGLLVGTAVSGVLPLVNAELLVVGAAVAAPGVSIPVLTVISTAGQMFTKTLLFALARWAPSRLPRRARRALERMGDRVRTRDTAAGSMVFTSAATGIPPFYGVSLACGALGMRMPLFLSTGTVGRALRFGLLAWLARQVGRDALSFVAAVDFALPALGS